MSAEEETVLMAKGIVSELPAADQEVCNKLAEHFRVQIRSAGLVGVLAFSLVGAEMQLEAAKNESTH